MTLLATKGGVPQVQAALREMGLDGWLLYEFHGINPVAVRLLGLGHTTRRGFVLVPDQGEPVALVHAIEASSWRHWPFEMRTYSGWKDMESELAKLLTVGRAWRPKSRQAARSRRWTTCRQASRASCWAWGWS